MANMDKPLAAWPKARFDGRYLLGRAASVDAWKECLLEIDWEGAHNDYMNAADQTWSIAAKWARLADAITYALDIHAGQTRKGAETPYASHLLGVSSLVLEHGGDEEQAMAGMLHDAIEDCGAEQ